ncbi:hypothetical protein M231_01836 [Tremella mesenterica]|uniref:Uncharacterized protein n=1 Tax=Tremella mesenterica TaxID=5217 RepID=A0A4Q1BSQ1_TREME|nr:hypothetical protein M231_01836 [Tremella mesenterica]
MHSQYPDVPEDSVIDDDMSNSASLSNTFQLPSIQVTSGLGLDFEHYRCASDSKSSQYLHSSMMVLVQTGANSQQDLQAPSGPVSSIRSSDWRNGEASYLSDGSAKETMGLPVSVPLHPQPPHLATVQAVSTPKIAKRCLD